MSSLVEEVPRGGNQFSGPGSCGTNRQLTSTHARRGSRRRAASWQSSSARARQLHRELPCQGCRSWGQRSLAWCKQRKHFRAFVLLIASNHYQLLERSHTHGYLDHDYEPPHWRLSVLWGDIKASLIQEQLKHPHVAQRKYGVM